MTQQPSVRSSYQPVRSRRSHLHIMRMILFHFLKAWPASGTATNKSSPILQCAILTPTLIRGKQPAQQNPHFLFGGVDSVHIAVALRAMVAMTTGLSLA